MPVPPPLSSPSPRPLDALLATPVWIDAGRPPEPFAAEAGLRWRRLVQHLYAGRRT